MNARRNDVSKAAKRLLSLFVIMVILTGSFSLAESIAYQGGTLTLEPPENQLSIRLTPQLLGLWDEYYYTPDASVQKELRTILDNLELVNYTIDDEFWHEHPEAGYTIVDPANQTEWMMLTGDHVLYTMYELKDDSAYMHRRYAECPELTQYLSPILDSTLQYAFFDITSLTGLTSATLTLADGQTETITDPSLLSLMESWFSQAYYMRAPSCPNGDVLLTLTTGTGQSAELLLATDECPYFSINGIYYDYTPAEFRDTASDGQSISNKFLFDCFTSITFQPIDLHPLH